MKKIVYILLAVLALGFASCEKDNDAIVFKATAEAPTNGGKTSVNLTSGYLNWKKNDAVKIKCNNGSNWYTFVNGSENDASVAQFVCPSGNAAGFDREAASYQAVYPASLEDGGVITLPSEQEYIASNISGFPMYTETTNDHLQFKNACGVLKLHVNGNVTVSEIWVSSSQAMCGTVSVGNSAANYAFTATSTASEDKQVKLKCGSGVAVSVSKDFYIYLPQNYYTGLTVKVFTNDGYEYTRHAATSTGLIIERNKVTTLPFTLEGSVCSAPAMLDDEAMDMIYNDAYSWFSDDIAGIQFHYNHDRSSASGTVDCNDDIYYYLDNDYILHICTPKRGMKVTTYLAWSFFNLPAVANIDFGDYFYTSDVTDMTSMFQYCSNLNSVYLGKNFYVSPSVNCNWMFATGGSQIEISCTSETKANLENIFLPPDKPATIIWHELD